MISFAVGYGSGVVGVGCQVVQFCDSIVRALGHAVLLAFQTLNHGRSSSCARETKIPRFTRDDNEEG